MESDEKAKVEISVIIPNYNEEKAIRIFFDKLTGTLKKVTEKFEIIYVDDGSSDESIAILRKLRSLENRLKIIKFDRNYGIFSALFAGISYAKGEVVILMDGDLQIDPAQLPNFLEKINQGYEIAFGWRKNRKDIFFPKKMASFIMNLILSHLSSVKLHDRGCNFKAYRKKVVEDIKNYGSLFTFGSHLRNYKIVEVKITHHPRPFGESQFNFITLFKHSIKVILSNIKKPCYKFNRPKYIIEKIYE